MTNKLLTQQWCNALAAYKTLFVGFSGGLDSTVLLHSLASEPALSCKLQAVHIHHGLSTNADRWQTHCQQLCDSLGIPFITRKVEFDASSNVEEGARIARYQVFSSLLANNDALLLGHHCDDQAETLLLQLFRGAGIDGLASMAQSNALAKGTVVRPFLQHSRQRLEAYAEQQQLAWVDDESNQNSVFSRNYLRHQIMPLLKEKWPGVVDNLVRTATHCQQAKTNLAVLAVIDCTALQESADTLDLLPIQSLDRSRFANVLRTWLQNNGVRPPSAAILNRLMDEIILGRPDATPIVQWGGVAVRRYKQTLYLIKNEAQSGFGCVEWSIFPEPLLLDRGRDSTSHYLRASVAAEGVRIPAGSLVQIRFRQGGELFHWHGQTKELKKLMQQWQVPPWQRDTIPLVYIDNELAMVVGFAISDNYFSSDAEFTYHLELN